MLKVSLMAGGVSQKAMVALPKNPYDFVPLEGSIRRYPLTSRSGDEGSTLLLTGKLVCSLKAETPLFIGSGKGLRAPSLRCIPASSIKGAVRAVAEAVSNSCLSVVSQVYKDRRRGDLRVDLPEEYRPCADPGSPCFCCRLFGMAEGKEEQRESSAGGEKQGGRGGRVVFSTADFTVNNEGPKMATFKFPARRMRDGGEAPMLGKPVPWHESFYFNMTEEKKEPLGRKFYYHHQDWADTIRTYRKKFKRTFGERYAEWEVQAIGADNVSKCEIRFFDLDWDELNVLLHSLKLEDNMRHHLGMLKPFGLGSVSISVSSIELRSSGSFMEYGEEPGKRGACPVAWKELRGSVSSSGRRDLWVNVNSIDWKDVAEQAWSVSGERPRAGEAREKLKEILKWPGEGVYLYPDLNGFFRIPGAGSITLKQYQSGERP